jgi:hypothetical protein
LAFDLSGQKRTAKSRQPVYAATFIFSAASTTSSMVPFM